MIKTVSVKGYAAMIFQPKIGQEAVINYKDKSMPFQGVECEILGISKGPGPRNVLVIITYAHDFYGWQYEVIPKGNLVAI